MSLYRKKPVVIEARQFTTHGPLTGGELAAWCGGRYFPESPFAAAYQPVIEIGTPEGTVTAQLGDWIIKGVQGEFYPCKSDIFAATYEEVADDGGSPAVPEVRGDEAP